MNTAKQKFDMTIMRCKDMIHMYDGLQQKNTASAAQDILRGAIVLSVAAFDAYATDCFSDYFVKYIKRHGVDEPLESLLSKAGYSIKFSIELLHSKRPYRKIRTLIDKYYAQYTTQKLSVIDELFLQFHLKDLTSSAARRSGRDANRLLNSVEKLIARRHSIVHDGDYSEQNRIKKVSRTDVNRINDIVTLVENMDAIICNKMK